MNKNMVLVESPGRINMIGEHIDYNGGVVMPASINKKLLIEIQSSTSEYSIIKSKLFNESIKVDLKKFKRSEVSWHNFILGVLDNLINKKGFELSNFHCVIGGDLPVGAGISSSSALICGLLKGICLINNLNLNKDDIIKIAREVEHEYIGVKGGIMDQFTIMNGKTDKLILLDCRDRTHKYIDIDFNHYKVLLLNTNVKHNLSETSYNERVLQCGKALKIINGKDNKYKFLTEVPLEILQKFKTHLNKKIFNRALFVIQEQERVHKAYNKLLTKDIYSFGELMYKSHEGLRNLYDVSCEELDFLVDFSMDKKYVIGSRMMGGGFGGCVINLIDSVFLKKYINEISDLYNNKFSLNLNSDVVTISNGLTNS